MTLCIGWILYRSYVRRSSQPYCWLDYLLLPYMVNNPASRMIRLFTAYVWLDCLPLHLHWMDSLPFALATFFAIAVYGKQSSQSWLDCLPLLRTVNNPASSIVGLFTVDANGKQSRQWLFTLARFLTDNAYDDVTVNNAIMSLGGILSISIYCKEFRRDWRNPLSYRIKVKNFLRDTFSFVATLSGPLTDVNGKHCLLYVIGGDSLVWSVIIVAIGTVHWRIS